MSNRSSYDACIAARLPKEMPQLISMAASNAFISPSAYIRQAIAEKLKRDGYPLTSTRPAAAQMAA